ncbi:MAG TPA: hypothetical protein DIW41_07225, partial [Lachnospiraceae bacterium]|nr:hypothetical protein [Lachnospiraceae bacterium]
MSSQFDYGIFGGDLRQVHIAEALLQKGYKVAVYGLVQSVNHDNCSAVLTLHELFEKSSVL